MVEILCWLQRVYQQENKVLLITDKKERHQLLKKLWDEEVRINEITHTHTHTQSPLSILFMFFI